MPFVLLRIGIGILLGLFTVLYFGIILWFLVRFLGDGAGLGGSGTVSMIIAGIGLLVSLILFRVLWRALSKYILYLVKAGHIAVIAHIIETDTVPDNQIAYGTGQVKEYFTQASTLFVIDQLVKMVIKQFNSRVTAVSGAFSAVPTLKTIIKIVGKAISVAASYIDEAIIAYLFVDDEPNKWRSARDGVVLYGKTWKPVLASTVVLVLAMYVASFVLLVSLSPLAGFLSGLSVTYELLGWVVVVAVFLTIYTGFVKPWVKTVVITTFLMEARHETPDSATMDRIGRYSESFQELMEKAEAEDGDGSTDTTDDTDRTTDRRSSHFPG